MLVLNGVDAASGEYLLPPTSAHELSLAVLGVPDDEPRTTGALLDRHRRRTEDHLGPRFGVDPRDLAQAGWAVILPAGADPDVLAALRPLLELRRRQATATSEGLYREFTGELGYQPGESKDAFVARHGAGPGPVRPEMLPYYLLLVGGPDQIPFLFQAQLAVQHAVGRLAFEDPGRYAAYAENVVAAARDRAPRPVRLSVFAPRAENDPATDQSSRLLAGPVADSLGEDEQGWTVTRLLETGAHKEQLLTHLGGPERPDLLLSASHGVGFPRGHPCQRQAQGALVCQDWPGPGTGPMAASHYLAAADLAARPELDLTGLIAVSFACFGAGTPRYDVLAGIGGTPRELADAPFVSALPQLLLGREAGALAVVGHVDRAWSYSFAWPGAGAQTEVFRSLLASLGAGDPLGVAMSFFTDRYAELAAELALMLGQARLGRRLRDEELAGVWTAYADARDFVVLGDPAVSLAPSGTPTLDAAPLPDRLEVRTSPSDSEASSPTDPPHDEAQSLSPAPGATLAGAVTDAAVEVATYVTRDPSRVEVDPASGRITGADLVLLSHVRLDGSARHVVTLPGADEAARTEVAEIHARLLEVSLAARRSGPAPQREQRP